MNKESTKENIEFEFVYDALEELYISSESQGFEIRYVVQLLYQLIGVKIFEIADNNEQAFDVIMGLSKHLADKFDVGNMLEIANLSNNKDNKTIH